MPTPESLPTLPALDAGVQLQGGHSLLPADSSLTPRYDVLRCLGEGGMGRVLLVRDRQLRREVALKVMQRGEVSEQGIRRFLAETQVTAQLSHPNIVPIYDSGMLPDGELYVTMKLIEGSTLRQVLSAYRGFSALRERNRILRLLIETTRALAYAHERGVVHRDLKPENIMVGPFGETIVVDWGLAKVLGRAEPVAPAPRPPAPVELDPAGAWRTADGAIVGTIHYLSPEQAEGRTEDIDATTDIWALGVILYEFLTGKMPHQGESAAAILLSIASSRRIEPEELGREAPAELAAIARKCLEPRREDRYRTAGELRKDLEAYLDGRPIAAASYGILELAGKWIRRHRAVSAVSAVAVLALAALSGASYRRIEERRREAEREREIAVQARIETEALLALRDRREAGMPLFERGRRVLDEARWYQRQPGARYDVLVRMLEEGRGLVLSGAERSPDLAVGPLLAGVSWESQGRALEAEKEYRRALDLDPSTGVAWLLVGRQLVVRRELVDLALRWGRVEPAWRFEAVFLAGEARKALESALLPENGPIEAIERSTARALLARLGPDAAAAREAAAEGARLFSGRAGAEEFHWLAGLASAGDARRAAFDRALEENPNHPVMRLSRGAFRADAGDLEGALEDLDRALEFGPELPYAWVERAIARRRAGRTGESIADLEKALEVAPANWPRRRAVERMLEEARQKGG